MIQEENQLYGCIKNLGNFKVNLTLKNVFELEDDYGNILYIAKYNNKEKVFKLINSNEFQLCDNIYEFEKIIKKYFNRV